MHEKPYQYKNISGREGFDHAASDDYLLKKLTEPYHMEVSRRGEKKKPMECFSNPEETKRTEEKKHFQTMKITSESGKQQLGYDPKEKKHLLMASSHKSPSGDAPRSRMAFLQKNRASQKDRGFESKLYLSEGAHDGATLLEMDGVNRPPKEHFRRYAKEEKSAMLAYLMPYVDTEEDCEKREALGRRLRELKKEIAHEQRENGETKALEEEKRKTEDRINRVNEILQKKDQAFLRMGACIKQGLPSSAIEEAQGQAEDWLTSFVQEILGEPEEETVFDMPDDADDGDEEEIALGDEHGDEHIE